MPAGTRTPRASTPRPQRPSPRLRISTCPKLVAAVRLGAVQREIGLVDEVVRRARSPGWVATTTVAEDLAVAGRVPERRRRDRAANALGDRQGVLVLARGGRPRTPRRRTGRECRRGAAATGARPRRRAAPRRRRDARTCCSRSASRSRLASRIDTGCQKRRARSISASRAVVKYRALKRSVFGSSRAASSMLGSLSARVPTTRVRAGTARSPEPAPAAAASPPEALPDRARSRGCRRRRDRSRGRSCRAGDPEHLGEQHVVDEHAGCRGDLAPPRVHIDVPARGRRGRRTGRR